MAELSALTVKARRVLRRHRRPAVALTAATAVFAVVQAVSPSPPPTTPVAVAARDLDAGTVLTGADVRVVRLPSDLAPAGVAATAGSVLNQTLAAPVRRGEPISDRRVVGASLVAGYPDGLVASPVRVEDADIVTLLQVGDRIDVYVAEPDAADRARQVVTDAAVVTLPQRSEQSRDGALVVLAVSSADAAALAQASALGPLSISLRG